MKKILLTLTKLALPLVILTSMSAESISIREKTPDWFRDARFGIFVHWGVYSAHGYGESWPFFNGQVSYEKYMLQKDDFTASNYDPSAWADLFVEAGAKYSVLTTKHHDGVALWDTKGNDLSVVKQTPAGRDLVEPYVDALRDAGLKVGLYYSHLDWSHPDYRVWPKRAGGRQNEFNSYDGDEPDMVRWNRFLDFHRLQLAELCEQYEPDLLWFDGDWERSEEAWRMKELRDFLKGKLPEVVLNSRMGEYGDYETPEQGIPVTAPEGAWELCLTMNGRWSYVPDDKNYKTPGQLIRILAECAGMGGNLLLNVGPREDGTIGDEEVSILKEMGTWNRKNGEALYGTVGGLDLSHYGAPSTLSKDGRSIYLFVFAKPESQILLKGLRNDPVSITILGEGHGELSYDRVGGAPWANVPGAMFVTLPEDLEVGHGVVVKVQLGEDLDLYTGKSGAIEQN